MVRTSESEEKMKGKLILYTIGGIPGSGKSTLIKEVLDHFAPFKLRKFGTVLYHQRTFPEDVIVMGQYKEGDLFPGTDRLSMAVIPHALQFMEYLWKGMKDRESDLTVFVEGDRLFCDRWISEAKADEHRIIVLHPSLPVWTRRMEERMIFHKQSDKFLRSRKTKVSNMLRTHPEIVKEPFNNERDFERVFNSITDHILPF